jgi:cell division protein ZapA
MGSIVVAVGGRRYPLSCADGEEGYIASLAGMLAAKADELTTAIGTMSEPRLLLMAGLQIADDLAAARSAGGDRDTDGGAGSGLDAAALLARIEALAAALEA